MISTYFTNQRAGINGLTHRVNTGSDYTACGLLVSGSRLYTVVANDVNCKNCKDTDTYRRGGR